MFKSNWLAVPVVAVFLFLSLSACTKAEQPALLGEEFTLAPGHSRAIAGQDLRLKFMTVVQDNRCPRNVVCITAGEAKVSVEATYKGETESLALVQPGLTEEAGVESFKAFKLAVRVQPYPEAGKQTKPEDYRLLVKVTK